VENKANENSVSRFAGLTVSYTGLEKRTGVKMNILAVFAHPDDETYGPAATLARYALSGQRVSLVTMTRGEAGSLGICKDMDPKDIAAMRSAELKCAAKALHIQHQKIYDLPDKGLTDYPPEKGVGIIRQEINTHQPDIVITFHNKGISGHPDHIDPCRSRRV